MGTMRRVVDRNRIDFYGIRGSPVVGNLPLHFPAGSRFSESGLKYTCAARVLYTFTLRNSRTRERGITNGERFTSRVYVNNNASRIR